MEERKTTSVMIGYNDYYVVFGNVFLAIDKKPNLFCRILFKMAGIGIISDEERKKIIKELDKKVEEEMKKEKEANES